MDNSLTNDILASIDTAKEKQAKYILESIISDVLITNPNGEPNGYRELVISQDSDYSTNLSDSLMDVLFDNFSNTVIYEAAKDAKKDLNDLGYQCDIVDDPELRIKINY